MMQGEYFENDLNVRVVSNVDGAYVTVSIEDDQHDVNVWIALDPNHIDNLMSRLKKAKAAVVKINKQLEVGY